MTTRTQCIDCGADIRATSRFGGPSRCDHHRLARPQIAPTLTVAQWNDRLAAFGGACAYCGVRDGSVRQPWNDPRLTVRLTVDHVVPRSRGGTHDLDNIVPACPACNCEKGDMLLLEWVAFRIGLASRKSFGYLRRVEEHRRAS